MSLVKALSTINFNKGYTYSNLPNGTRTSFVSHCSISAQITSFLLQGHLIDELHVVIYNPVAYFIKIIQSSFLKIWNPFLSNLFEE